jgi:hypothetical protein
MILAITNETVPASLAPPGDQLGETARKESRPFCQGYTASSRPYGNVAIIGIAANAKRPLPSTVSLAYNTSLR